jgi:hypothetical protein
MSAAVEARKHLIFQNVSAMDLRICGSHQAFVSAN